MFTMSVAHHSTTNMQQGKTYSLNLGKNCLICTPTYRNKIIVLANTFDDSEDADWSSWFIFDPYFTIWTKQHLPKEVSFPTKPNWFLIPILGELHLFLPNHTFRYHSETATWTSIDLQIDLPIEDIEVLRIGFGK